MSRCCICGREVDSENAPVLAMSAYGNPRLVCPVCEANIDEATNGREPDKILLACRNLGDDLTAFNNDEIGIINAVNRIITEATERCDAIKRGDYDFDAENNFDSEEFDITEDLMETEEDRQLVEAEARTAEKLDKIISWASGIIIAAVVLFFIIRLIFF